MTVMKLMTTTNSPNAAKVTWTEVATGAGPDKSTLLDGPSMSCRV